jgi:hypothetical protein
MTGRGWALVLFSISGVDLFAGYVVFVSHLDALSWSAVVAFARDTRLADLGLIVGTNALATMLLGLAIVLRPTNPLVHRIVFLVSCIYVALFSWAVLFRGYPVLVPLAVLNGLSAWQYRRGRPSVSR